MDAIHNLWSFIGSATQMTVIIPAVLAMVPWWRFSRRVMVAWAVGLEVLMGVMAWGIWALLGLGDLSVWLVGLLAPTVCSYVFWYCCSLRGGRFLFMMVTLALYSLLCDSIAGMLYPRSTLQWDVLRILVGLVLFFLLYLFWRRYLLEMLDAGQINWTEMSLIPFMLWVCMFTVYLPKTFAEDTMPAPFTLIYVAAVVLIYVMLYRFQRATLEEAESRKYGALLQSEIRFLERETRHAKTVEESTKILRHDLRHFTRLIQGSLDRGDLDSARQVTALLEEKASALMRAGDLKRYTGRPLLDTVLSQAQERARELGAGFTVGVDLPDHLPMEDTELAVTFSNALENALNAVAQEPPGAGRWVAVHGKNLGSQYLLEFANAFSGQVELDSKTSLPQGGAQGHGYGTQSIARFAKRYSGAVDCQVKDGKFLLRVLL